MVTSAQALKKYGEPSLLKGMVLFDVPTELEIGVIPKKIYCNQDFVEPIKKAFTLLKERGLSDDLRTYDGCFNIRKTRGASSMSLHSWGIAIDFDAAWNRLGVTPIINPAIVACFKEAGFDWGGDFKRLDGMHFQLASI